MSRGTTRRMAFGRRTRTEPNKEDVEEIARVVVELAFDQTSADKRDRYQSARMLLSQDANDYNNRAVEFRLEERIPNPSQWRVYAKAVYTLKRSFTSDFDF